MPFTVDDTPFGSLSVTLADVDSTLAASIMATAPATLSLNVGTPGPGVPAGGSTGMVLKKVSGTDYDTAWQTDLNSGVWGQISGTITNQLDLVAALNLKADLASPALTGVPTAPTAATLTSTTQIATTAFVQQELAAGTAVAKNLEVYVRNQTGATLTAGTIVYIDGATGNRPTVTKAQANNDANSAQTFGFTKTSIANNGFGYVIVRGELENVDTSALTEGQQLYLSPTTAGTWTTTKPSAPDHLVYVGIVVRAHPTQGIILVAIQNGYELTELHDVKITSASNGQVLKYDSAQGLWVNGTDVGGVAWGGITGTLSNQTDLQTALDAKFNKSGGAFDDGATITMPSTAGGAGIEFATAQMTIESNTAATDFTYVSYDQVLVSDADGSTMHTATGITFPDATFQSTAYPGSSGFLLKADNLSGLADTSVARTNLGLGTMATATAADYSTTTVANGLYYPLSSNPAGYLTTAPVTSVAGKTGAVTLTNTDISGLGTMATETASNYLTTASASSTYLTQANAASTYQTQAGMSSYLTTASAASTYYPLTGNPSGFLTSAPVTSVAGKTGAVTLTSTDISGLGTMATANASDYSTTTVANGLYYPLSSNPAGYLTSAPVTSVAGKTGAVTLVVGDVSGAAPTASPALTGTPTAPTATLSDNSTTIATTAFVKGQGYVTSAGGIDFQDFTTAGSSTWTKPANAKWVQIIIHGGGGGGGSGARYATSAVRGGGGAGGQGALLTLFVSASTLGSTETVVVGAGGSGGASRTTDSTSGSNGTAGTASTFAGYRAGGGNPGAGGTNTAGGTGGGGSQVMVFGSFALTTGITGGSAGTLGVTPTAPTSMSMFAIATSGGGGAGQNNSVTTSVTGGTAGSKSAAVSSNSGLVSGVSGGAGGTTGGTNPTSGTAGSAFIGGTGGGGGAYRTGVAGMAGANGSSPAGGGGGGSASDNGFASGAGGAGGTGRVTIITYT